MIQQNLSYKKKKNNNSKRYASESENFDTIQLADYVLI